MMKTKIPACLVLVGLICTIFLSGCYWYDCYDCRYEAPYLSVADVSGVWVVTIYYDDGTMDEWCFDIYQNGMELTGTSYGITDPDSAVEIYGVIDEFDDVAIMELWLDGEYIYSGVLRDEMNMDGVCCYGDGTDAGDWYAVRQ